MKQKRIAEGIRGHLMMRYLATKYEPAGLIGM